MLAFNLGVFFRNLRGQPVAFHAQRAGAEVHFIGRVESLREQTDLVNHLSVVLAQDDLRLGMDFDEHDGEEDRADPEVRVTLIRLGMTQPMFEARFTFEETRLQPIELEAQAEARAEIAPGIAPVAAPDTAAETAVESGGDAPSGR